MKQKVNDTGMDKGLGKFCRDVDKLTKDLWRTDHFKAALPRVGDHLILVLGNQVVKVEVIDVVRSTVANTGVVTARIVASPPLTGKDSLVGKTVSGAYADGEAVWTDQRGKTYMDYRLFIQDMAKRKTFQRMTGRLRKVIKANNGSVNIALTDPLAPSLFQQTATLRDVLFWSKKRRHYLSVFTTLFNSGLAVAALLHNQNVAALLMAVCSLICFGCLHVELQRQKTIRAEFVKRKTGVDNAYQALRQQIQEMGLGKAQQTELQVVLCRYHLLIMEHIHPHFGGLLTAWTGRLHNAVEEMPAATLLYHIDQYVEALYLPD